jgi:hypothetical protein
MSAPMLSPPTQEPGQTSGASGATGATGATGVARQVIDGLSGLVHDHTLLHAFADVLLGMLPGYGSMWHIARAAHADDPALALREIRERLDMDVDRSVDVAIKVLQERGGTIRTAPSSSLVKAVAAALPAGTVDQPTSARCTGLAGADAISPNTVLNIRGTLDLARWTPTIIVTTSLKLVPETVFVQLGSPAFERIPLHLFEAVVLDGEVLSPAEVGRRAAAIR